MQRSFLDGTYPLIMIAHGNGGNSFSHHLLARELAKNGFMVASPHFQNDRKRGDSPELFLGRVREMNAAIHYLITHPDLEKYIDGQKIGMFGYSLGGFTALASAGGEFDLSRVVKHCLEPQNDPNFCSFSDNQAGASKAYEGLTSPMRITQNHSAQIRAMVLAAPLGVAFSNLDLINFPIQLYRAEKDEELRFPFHAEYIHKLLPSDHEYFVLENLHHYAFLVPFPESISKEVGKPAMDPEGFDRAEFHEKLNAQIADYFSKTLKN